MGFLEERGIFLLVVAMEMPMSMACTAIRISTRFLNKHGKARKLLRANNKTWRQTDADAQDLFPLLQLSRPPTAEIKRRHTKISASGLALALASHRPCHATKTVQ